MFLQIKLLKDISNIEYCGGIPQCTCSLSKLGLRRAYDTEIKRDRYPQGALNTHI